MSENPRTLLHESELRYPIEDFKNAQISCTIVLDGLQSFQVEGKLDGQVILDYSPLPESAGRPELRTEESQYPVTGYRVPFHLDLIDGQPGKLWTSNFCLSADQVARLERVPGEGLPVRFTLKGEIPLKRS